MRGACGLGMRCNAGQVAQPLWFMVLKAWSSSAFELDVHLFDAPMAISYSSASMPLTTPSATSEEETDHSAFSMGLPFSSVSWTVGGMTSNTLIEVPLSWCLNDFVKEWMAAL